MDFAEDIVLGDISGVDLGEAETRPGQDRLAARPLSGLQLGFLVSTLLHFSLASMLFYFIGGAIQEIDEPAFSTLRVEFVPSNPQLIQAEEAIAGPLPTSASTIPLEEIDPSPIPLEEPQLKTLPIEASASTDTQIVEVLPVESSVQPLESIAVPTVETVQSVLNDLQRSDASRFYSYDCNKLEEEREFTKCAPGDGRDYSLLTRNPVYEFHNPAIEVTRSRATVTTLARASARVSEQLDLNNLPPGLSGYVLEELEQGIETYSNNSVRVVDHMNTMVDKSAAGVMARRIFDTWVQQSMTQLQSRRVENRGDRQFRERCRSYEKFIMAPSEFARCLSVGESPLGFSVEF